MGISRINNNISTFVQQQLNARIAPQLQESIERLTSGLRINQAGDNAAGLTVANRLQSQARGLNQAFTATQDGINLVNTADQGLASVGDSLQRIRELSVQAGNTGVLDQQALGAIQAEIDQNIAQINQVASNTQFGSNRLFAGDFAPTAGVREGTPDRGVSVDTSSLSTTENFLTIEQLQDGSAQVAAGEAAGQPQVINTGIANTQDVAVTEGTLVNSTAGAPAAAGDALTDLTFNSATLQDGGTISFQGVLADGTTTFSGSFQISAATDLAGGGGANTSLADAIQSAIDAAETDAGVNTAAGDTAAETNVAFDASTGRLAFSNGANQGVSQFDLTFAVDNAAGQRQTNVATTRAAEINGQATGAQTGNAVDAFTGSTFDTGELTIEVSDVTAAQRQTVESSLNFEQAGGGALQAGDSLIGSVFNGATLAQGDTIELNGTNADGTTFSNSITISTVDGATGNGAANTFQDLIDELNVRDQSLAAGGIGNQSGFTDATAAITSTGGIRVTDDVAGASQTNFTLTINDNSGGGGTFGTIVSDANLAQAGQAQEATLRVNGGPAQRAQAGELVTLRDSSGANANEITFRLGDTLSNGTDVVNNTASRFEARLNGGPAVQFGAGDQDVQFESGLRPGETLTLDFDAEINVPGTGDENASTVIISATASEANFQIGGNPGQNLGVSFGDLRANALGFGEGRSVADIDVTQPGGVNEALSIVDEALSQINDQRSALGATSNRLASTANSLAISSENLLAAQSRIEDADFARESTRLAMNQILLQANVSVQEQANNLQNNLFTELMR